MFIFGVVFSISELPMTYFFIFGMVLRIVSVNDLSLLFFIFGVVLHIVSVNDLSLFFFIFGVVFVFYIWCSIAYSISE